MNHSPKTVSSLYLNMIVSEPQNTTKHSLMEDSYFTYEKQEFSSDTWTLGKLLFKYQVVFYP